VNSLLAATFYSDSLILLRFSLFSLIVSLSIFPSPCADLTVKARLQSGSVKYSSSLEGLRTIIREEGISGLYRGIAPKLYVPFSSAFLLVYKSWFNLLVCVIALNLWPPWVYQLRSSSRNSRWLSTIPTGCYPVPRQREDLRCYQEGTLSASSRHCQSKLTRFCSRRPLLELPSPSKFSVFRTLLINKYYSYPSQSRVTPRASQVMTSMKRDVNSGFLPPSTLALLFSFVTHFSTGVSTDPSEGKGDISRSLSLSFPYTWLFFTYLSTSQLNLHWFVLNQIPHW